MRLCGKFQIVIQIFCLRSFQHFFTSCILVIKSSCFCSVENSSPPKKSCTWNIVFGFLPRNDSYGQIPRCTEGLAFTVLTTRGKNVLQYSRRGAKLPSASGVRFLVESTAARRAFLIRFTAFSATPCQKKNNKNDVK